MLRRSILLLRPQGLRPLRHVVLHTGLWRHTHRRYGSIDDVSCQRCLAAGGSGSLLLKLLGDLGAQLLVSVHAFHQRRFLHFQRSPRKSQRFIVASALFGQVGFLAFHLGTIRFHLFFQLRKLFSRGPQLLQLVRPRLYMCLNARQAAFNAQSTVVLDARRKMR